MKILVTGAGGFIGSHLTERLSACGNEVRAFVRYCSTSSWGWLDSSEVKNDIEVIRGDIRDLDGVRRAMQGCEAVFHLAALIGIPYSYVSPLAYVKTNVEGTYNVLEAARDMGVSRVVHTSTSEIYGTAQYVPIDESHPVNPQSPYSATKSAADLLAISYFRSFELPVTVVRPFNTYGPRQSARAVIPSIITQLLSAAPSVKLGDTSPTRDLTYVSDTVSGLISAGLSPNTVGEVVGLGVGQEISIRELAEKIAALMGREIVIEQEEGRVRPAKSEVERLCSNPSKARELAGWSAEVSLSDGLRRTAAWISENRFHFREGEYSI